MYQLADGEDTGVYIYVYQLADGEDTGVYTCVSFA